jgi:hypothetical protein
VTGLLALAALTAAFGSQPAATADRAALRVTSTAPLVVRGSLFAPRERVAVVARAKGVHQKTVFATARGTFVVAFRGLMLDNCDVYVVRATGSRGNYGFVRSIPECNPIGPVGP